MPEQPLSIKTTRDAVLAFLKPSEEAAAPVCIVGILDLELETIIGLQADRIEINGATISFLRFEPGDDHHPIGFFQITLPEGAQYAIGYPNDADGLSELPRIAQELKSAVQNYGVLCLQLRSANGYFLVASGPARQSLFDIAEEAMPGMSRMVH
jgi:hypothetical protein